MLFKKSGTCSVLAYFWSVRRCLISDEHFPFERLFGFDMPCEVADSLNVQRRRSESSRWRVLGLGIIIRAYISEPVNGDAGRRRWIWECSIFQMRRSHKILILRLKRRTCPLRFQETFGQLRFLSELKRHLSVLGKRKIIITDCKMLTYFLDTIDMFRSRKRATAEVRTVLESLSIPRWFFILRLACKHMSCCFLIHRINGDWIGA